VLRRLLAEEASLTELAVAQTLGERLPDGALLFVGASMPIRDLHATCPPREHLRIVTNRGVAGIDGAVSIAVGAALEHQLSGGVTPAYALLGDLTLLHDHNGLILGPGERRPDLTIVCVNNNGGGIFSTLPQAQQGDAVFERLFGTPHDVELAPLAAAVGVEHQRITRRDELIARLETPRPGLTLLEVVTDRRRSAAHHARLAENVAKAFRELA
jgi:2-succinyl-5-enolpyruvyl-6-hydroxy-3-cyclohexene-1-carboxylate synthase